MHVLVKPVCENSCILIIPQCGINMERVLRSVFSSAALSVQFVCFHL